MASFASNITLIRATVSDVNVPAHERPLSMKATLRGMEEFAFGKQRLSLTPGKVLLTPGETSYASRVPAGQATSSIALFFPNNAASSAFGDERHILEGRSHSSPTEDFPAHCSPSSASTLPLLWRLATCDDKSECWDLSMTCLLITVEAAACSRKEMMRIPSARASVQRELFRRASLARQAIDEQPERAWSMEELGRVSCLSQFHLQRVFTAAFSETPFRYLRRRRLLRALGLLRSTNDPVQVVAGKVGFENTSSFIRSFRRDFDVSPGEFRAAMTMRGPSVPAGGGGRNATACQPIGGYSHPAPQTTRQR